MNAVALRQDPEIYQFPGTGQSVRAILIDGEPWFVASDVCAILGHTNTSVALKMLDDDERQTLARSSRSDTLNSDTLLFGDTRVQSRALVSEPGLFTLIMRSNVPGARPFKRWLTHDVLPSIRRTGSYSARGNESFPPVTDVTTLSPRDLARMILAESDRADAAEEHAAAFEAAAGAWNALGDAEGDYSLRDAALILTRDHGIDVGQNRLMRKLRGLGMVDDRGRPYAAHNSHLVARPTSYTHPRTGEPVLTHQVRVTLAGVAYLRRRLALPEGP